MDDTTTASQHTADTSIGLASLTTGALILIALFAVIVLAGIWWGIRLKRRRAAGERAFEARRDAAEAGTPGSTHLAAPPVAPGPPPLADEPMVAAAPFDASPAALAADVPPAPAPAPAAPTLAADLTQLKGLGPKLAATLAELGYTGIDQIAALTPAEAEALDAQLGAFRAGWRGIAGSSRRRCSQQVTRPDTRPNSASWAAESRFSAALNRRHPPPSY